MWAAIQSVYNGTWGDSAIPSEIIDFETMREMRWSWMELQETPVYVRRFVWDCIMARREAEQEQQKRQTSERDGRRRVQW